MCVSMSENQSPTGLQGAVVQWCSGARTLRPLSSELNGKKKKRISESKAKGKKPSVTLIAGEQEDGASRWNVSGLRAEVKCQRLHNRSGVKEAARS